MSCAALLLGCWEAARRSHYQPVTILVRQDLPAHKTTMAGGLFQPLVSILASHPANWLELKISPDVTKRLTYMYFKYQKLCSYCKASKVKLKTL